MNKLLAAKRAQILLMLCEGWSMRSVSRIVNYNLLFRWVRRLEHGRPGLASDDVYQRTGTGCWRAMWPPRSSTPSGRRPEAGWLFGNRGRASITCSRWRHEPKPGRLDQSRAFTHLACPFRIMCIASSPWIVRRAACTSRTPCVAFTRPVIAR